MNITAICWIVAACLVVAVGALSLCRACRTDEWDALRGESDTDGC